MYRIVIPVMLVITQPAAGAALLIDDDFSAYSATGLAPGGGGGALDSNLWAVAGASDGDAAFGVTRTGGDFARGRSPGGVGTGGLYAFLLPGDDPAIGVQATGGDFTPGSLARRAVNVTGEALTDLTVAMDLWYLNNASRSTRMRVEVTTSDALQWTALPGLALDTPLAPDALGWQLLPVLATLPVTLLEPRGVLLLRWGFDDLTGTGGRDEIALSRLRLSGATVSAAVPPAPVPAPPAVALAILALGACTARRWRARC